MAGKGCEHMGIYRAIAGITIVCTLFGLIEGTSMIACASEEKLVQYDVASSERDQYCVLTEEIGTYKVCEGDNLWRISETLLGNGKNYIQLAMQNADRIVDPNLIYPNMQLQVKRNVYVKRRMGVNGIKTPEYQFGTLAQARFGILESGKVFANCALFGEGVADVLCLIRDKEQAGEKALADWEHSRQQIEAYVKKNYAKKISNLTFYDYQTEDGRELHLFSYIYTIPGEQYGYQGELKIYVCEGVCQTEHIQAEFTGFDMEEGVQDVVLYMLASFEEFPEAKGASVNGYNIQIAPCDPWEVSGIHNSFVWIEQYFDTILSEISQKPTAKKNARERILGE